MMGRSHTLIGLAFCTLAVLIAEAAGRCPPASRNARAQFAVLFRFAA
jgi:hypothetical protein